MKKTLLLSLLVILFTSCDRATVPDAGLETALAASNPNDGAWISPEGIATPGSLIADYVITDQGIVEFDYKSPSNIGLDPSEVKGVLLAPETNSSVEAVKASLDAANAARSNLDSSGSGELETTAAGTVCTFLNGGCYYLVESDKRDDFNAVYTRVYLPSRARGEIKVEEDNFSACPGNKTRVYEVPYIFLGGHSKDYSYRYYQNIDAGLLWQCGSDSWAPFMNFSDNELKNFASTYRMPAGQEVRMTFHVRSISGGNDHPQIVITGNFVRKDGTKFTGTHRIWCGTNVCGGKWSRDGVDQNFRIEVNLAQGEYINGKNVDKVISNTGALFNNVQVRAMYLGKMLYNGSTQKYYWKQASKWNISANKSSSSLTEVQCITPSRNYTVTGTANTGSTGATVKIKVL